MPTLVKIRGLERGDSAVSSGSVGPARGFRMPSGLGLAYPAGVKASLTPTAATQTYTAKQGGTYGNSIKVQTAVGTLAVSVSYAAAGPTILVTAPATATLAANQAVVAAVNANADAAALVTASVAGAGTSAHAAVAATNLASGTNVGTGQVHYVPVSSKTTTIVDVDDVNTLKLLRRNQHRFISLGAA